MLGTYLKNYNGRCPSHSLSGNYFFRAEDVLNCNSHQDLD